MPLIFGDWFPASPRPKGSVQQWSVRHMPDPRFQQRGVASLWARIVESASVARVSEGFQAALRGAGASRASLASTIMRATSGIL